jgi:dihydrofolate reductase
VSGKEYLPVATVVLDLSVSLDGYIAAPDGMLGGEDGELLHRWAWGGGAMDRPDGPSKQGGSSATIGAMLTGRRLYDQMAGWGGNHPVQGVPLFVVTHRAPPARVPTGPTAITFVSDGVEQAVGLARAAAGNKNVYVIGGAQLADSLLESRLLDEIRLHVVPVLLRDGVRLFGASGGDEIGLELVEVISEPEVTHLRYRVASELEKI